MKQLLEHESSLVSEIQSLDSDCQTLVYDHYDKFIAAADIVRKVLYFHCLGVTVGALLRDFAQIFDEDSIINSIIVP